MREPSSRFMTWRDFTITPAIWALTLVSAAGGAMAFHARYRPDVLIDVLVFYSFLMFVTIVIVRLIRALFPLREGIYSYETNPTACYLWNLIGFLTSTNLGLESLHTIVPLPFRKLFYRLLGARLSRGLI